MMNPQVLEIVSEATFQSQIENLLTIHGWSAFHDLSGRTSGSCAKGFPDLIAIRGPELLALELKRMRGRVAPEQKAWIERFASVETCEAHIVRPNQFDWLESRLRPSPRQLTITSNSSSWISA